MTNLLASLNCESESHLIIVDPATAGSNAASLRINSIIESGAHPILFINSASGAAEYDFSPTLKDHISAGRLTVVTKPYNQQELTTHGRSEVDNVIDRAFVILPFSQHQLKSAIYQQCRKLRIPINVSDSAEFSTFTLLSTHIDGDFQLGVTTSGKGCKLASRIKRELVGHLPSNIGDVCNKVGSLRVKIQQEDHVEFDASAVGDDDDDAINTNRLNALVEEFNMTQEQKKLQRTRWLSQIVEYFPLSKLAELSLEDLTEAYKQQKNMKQAGDEPDAKRAKLQTSRGSISLVGSGPGSVSLLTLGAIQEIHSADLILADKLVPQQVLDLIPTKRTRLFIARKFPGNAERAQQELLSIGLESLLKGEKVVRLKQGDPYIFGRGGEEFNFFTSHGFTPVVLPGITSALSAPVLANIPVTHREVADQVLICTGTGRRGVLPQLPDFVKSRTTVFLMSLHRVVELIPSLINDKQWDPALPVAIIERSSCPDQRIIRTTLAKTAEAVEACGSRPPGLLVTGYSCDVIKRAGELSDKGWIVEEGYDYATDNLDSLLRLSSSARFKIHSGCQLGCDNAPA